VKDSASKIETISFAVEQMRSELVPSTEESNRTGEAPGGLLASIGLLLAESKERDQSLAVLHAAVNSLFAAVNEKITEGGNMLSTFLLSLRGLRQLM
jgi:hypothetical protein